MAENQTKAELEHEVRRLTHLNKQLESALEAERVARAGNEWTEKLSELHFGLPSRTPVLKELLTRAPVYLGPARFLLLSEEVDQLLELQEKRRIEELVQGRLDSERRTLPVPWPWPTVHGGWR